MPSMKHRGQHFIVTGAGSGIGRAVALRLASEGATVSLMGRRGDPLRETERLAVQQGAPDPFVVTCDVSDQATVSEAILAAGSDGQATGVAMKHLKSSGAVVDGKTVSTAVRTMRAG